MNRRGLWAACVVLLVGVGVLVVGTGFAEEEDAGAKCSEASLHGTYLLAEDGVVITGKDQVPFAAAGYEVFDGNGNVKSVFSLNFNGQVVDRNVHESGTYTVKADCTGTNTFTDGTHIDMFIASDGSELTVVQTHPKKSVTSWTTKRVGD